MSRLPTTKRMLSAVLLVGIMSACGGDDSTDSSKPSQSPTTTADAVPPNDPTPPTPGALTQESLLADPAIHSSDLLQFFAAHTSYGLPTTDPQDPVATIGWARIIDAGILSVGVLPNVSGSACCDAFTDAELFFLILPVLTAAMEVHPEAVQANVIMAGCSLEDSQKRLYIFLPDELAANKAANPLAMPTLDPIGRLGMGTLHDNDSIALATALVGAGPNWAPPTYCGQVP